MIYPIFNLYGRLYFVSKNKYLWYLFPIFTVKYVIFFIEF